MNPIALLLLAQLKLPFTAELTAYIDDFLRPVHMMRSFEKRRADSLALISSVLQWSEAYQVDPLLVAVIISFESSWRTNANGRLGEIGPMQVMPRYFGKRFDAENTDDQIHAGVYHLRKSLCACGDDLKRGLNHYGTGRCEPVGKWVHWRVRAYERAKRRYRKND